jgi:pantothenate synthetase
MSSRNALLSAEADDKAAQLFRALTTASSCAEAGAILEAQGCRVEYVEERWARRLAAVNLVPYFAPQLGGWRLLSARRTTTLLVCRTLVAGIPIADQHCHEHLLHRALAAASER